MNRSVALLLSSLCLCGKSFALDAEPKKPYELNVVVHVERNKLLTEVFQDRVQRELNDWLQEALGELARVKVTTRHPRLDDVVEKGLQSLDWRERSSAKTHFVLIRIVNNVYEVQTRQYDGLTGLVSPVRLERTDSRDDVSRTAALLIKHDFGLVGTVVGAPDRDGAVKVAIKGGGLKVPLDRWIAKGEVFALVKVQADGTPEGREPGAILRVTDVPKEGSGTCTSQLFYRFKDNPLQSGEHRCLKLGTKRGPVRLHVVQAGPDNTTRPLESELKVHVSPIDFDAPEPLVQRAMPARNGIIDTGEKHQYDHVAFVKVMTEPDAAKVPVPIVDDQFVEVRVRIIKDDKERLRLEREDWGHDVREARRVQTVIFQELKELASKPSGLSDAVKQAQEGLKRIRQDYQTLSGRKQKLVGDLEKAKLDPYKPPFDLTRDSKWLEQLKSSEQELIVFVAKLEEIDKKVNDPRRKTWEKQLQLGQAMEKKGDYDDVIALYEQMLENKYDPEDGSRAQVQKDLERLKKEWTPKTEEHRKARAFIMKIWPKLDTDGLEKRLEEAKAAVAACRDAKDKVTLSRFVNQLAQHGQELQKRLMGLNRVNVDDEPEIRRIEKLSAALFKLGDEVNQFLEAPDK